MTDIAKVPLFYNPDSGTSQTIMEKLQTDERLHLEEVRPEELGEKIDKAVEEGVERVLISGGDGTLALAASHLAGKRTVLGVIPAGTLNHFAQRLGIPKDVDEFVDTALNGIATPVDVGYVNDRLFINTSSVGAYTVFVSSRNQLEDRMPYSVASIVAGIRRLFNFRKVRVQLQGEELSTPLVFIG
ncbi:MAG: diacylglycerol kinase family protein, partial [Desulfocapsaceae bacterium]|nr:diacylglycerol kinase family protein [Desulfocapsaceae bacterium]